MEGVAYLIHRVGSDKIDKVAAARGVFRWGGQYWNRFDNEWQDSDKPRDFLTVADRAAFPLPDGGEWVECLICNGGR